VLKDWRPFQRSGVTAVRARSRAAARRRPPRRPLGKIAAAVAVGVVGAALLIMLAGQRDGDLLGRIRHGLRPAGASGTVVQATPSPAPEAGSRDTGSGRAPAPEPASPETAPPEPGVAGGGTAGLLELPARPEGPGIATRPVEAAAPERPGLPRPDAGATGPVETPGARGDRPREVVVGPGDVFSALVTRSYGRAQLTLLDFVKAANPDVSSVDVLRVGQRIKMPAFEPAALVQKADDGQYRLHLLTVWNAETPAVTRLRSIIAGQGRQVHMVPVHLNARDTAYRVVVGDFASRGDAETFYRDLRIPAGLSTQLWRQS
jgi:hypothetical protein